MNENETEKAKALPVPNRERIALWLAALRSGEYEQVEGGLREQDSYCCLGVACEVMRKQTGRGEWVGTTFRVEGENSCSVLPHPVQEWFGLEESNPAVSRGVFAPASEKSLASLNDGGKSFTEIAAVIEAKYLTPEPAPTTP
jgi:hypothetical protein